MSCDRSGGIDREQEQGNGGPLVWAQYKRKCYRCSRRRVCCCSLLAGWIGYIDGNITLDGTKFAVLHKGGGEVFTLRLLKQKKEIDGSSGAPPSSPLLSRVLVDLTVEGKCLKADASCAPMGFVGCPITNLVLIKSTRL